MAQASSRRRRTHANATGVATATIVVRQPSGIGRQQPVHETRVPFAVVPEYPGKGASRKCPLRAGVMVVLRDVGGCMGNWSMRRERVVGWTQGLSGRTAAPAQGEPG